VADGHKDSFTIQDGVSVSLHVSQIHTSHSLLVRADDRSHFRVPDELNLIVVKRLILHDF